MTYINYGKGLKMNQDGLFNNTLKTCDMEDCKSRQTPNALVAPLGTDSLGN